MSKTKAFRDYSIDMKQEDFEEQPQRVWINAPSSHNFYNKYHGKRGIGVSKLQRYTDGSHKPVVVVYFTEGALVGMEVDPLYLSRYFCTDEGQG